MDTKKPDLSQPELPKPDEKLLRAPTLLEKYPWIKLATVLVLVIIILGAGVGILNKDRKVVPPDQLPYTSPSVAPTIDVTANWKLYTNQPGKFSVKYPQEYTLQETVPNSPNAIQILSPVLPNINTNFRMTIAYKEIFGIPTLPQLIDQNKLCGDISSQIGTPSVINGKNRAQIYFETPCGQDIKTVIYTVNDSMFYIISIDTQANYQEIKPYIDQLIATLSFVNEPEAATDNPMMPSQKQTFCTMEAKLCPDGSSVGRHGAQCKFDACPGEKTGKSY